MRNTAFFLLLLLMLISRISVSNELNGMMFPMKVADVLLPITLSQAKANLHTNPSQCIIYTQQFLNNNASNNTESSSTSRYNQLNYFRAAQKVIALQLQAQCQAAIVQTDDAFASLKQAEEIAAHYKLKMQQSQNSYLRAFFYVHLNRKYKQAIQIIDQTISQLKEIPNYTSPLEFHLKLLRVASLISLKKLSLARSELERLHSQQKTHALPEKMAWLNYTEGNYYEAFHQPRVALEHYLKAYQQAQFLRSPILLYHINSLIAKLYRSLKDFDHAIQYQNQAAEIAKKQGNRIQLADSQMQLAKLYLHNDDANVALVYFFNALDLYRGLSVSQKISETYLQIGRTYLQINSLSLAEQYLKVALSGFKLLKDDRHLVCTQVQFAKLYQTNNQQSDAIELLKKQLPLANKVANIRGLEQIYSMLSELYKQEGNYQQAYEAYKKYIGFHHQRFSPMRTPQADMQILSFAQLSELQKLKESNENYRKNHLTLAFLLGLCTLSLFMLALVMLWMFLNNKRLSLLHQKMSIALYQDTRSGLPNWRKLLMRMPWELRNRQIRSEQWYLDEQLRSPVFSDQLHYLVFQVPFSRDLMDTHGASICLKLSKQLGQYIADNVETPARIYDLREGHLLLVLPQLNSKELHHKITEWLEYLEQFPCSYHIERQVSIGVIGVPFLLKEADAFNQEEISDIATLALAAANQLRIKTGRSSWVELQPINCPQAASFQGDIWESCVRTIDRGLLRVNTSHEDDKIDWHQLVRGRYPNL